ncbi:MAG TPA: YceI family protein [Flavisolibacter sp.]
MTTTKWVIDPTHSEIGFKIKHLMITNVSGKFETFEAEVQTEGDDFTTAQIEAKIRTASINTNNLQRDEHLRNSDFFEVDQHPEILFSSTKVEKVDEENFVVYGNLSLKGIVKPVKLNVEYSGATKDPWGNQKAGFVISGKINRSDFGLNFNAALETGGLVLGEEVKINSEVQLVKQVASVAA